MLWKRPFDWLAKRMGGLVNHAQDLGGRAELNNIGRLLLGMTLRALWKPCAGPVLGSTLTLIVTAHDLGRTTPLLLCYSIGAGMPMLAVAYGGQYVTTRVRRVVRYAAHIQQVFGVVIILTAITMSYQYDIQVIS